MEYTNSKGHVKLTVNKQWELNEGDDHYYQQPAEVIVNLLKNGVPADDVSPASKTLNEDNGWEAVWDRLDPDFVWSVEEVPVPGFTASVARDPASPEYTPTYHVTNTEMDPPFIAITVVKEWDIPSWQTQPDSVDVALLKDGEEFAAVTLSDENNWRHTWSRIDNSADSHWSVAEKEVPNGFTAAVTGGQIINGNAIFRIVNKSNPIPVDFTDLTVRKEWVLDNGGTPPESIEVELLLNGQVWDSVVLSGENGWTYLWDGLDSVFEWTVREKDVPEGFVSTVEERENGVFVITNDDIGPSPSPSPSPDPSPGPSSNPPATPDKPDGPALPQTGQPWWPVWIMAALGAVFFAIGVFLPGKPEGRHYKRRV